ncbi:MAG: YkgJ family cysteine cluster protein [Desulfobacteraceae bacterium]|nr:MAG: YkgJ family cysteine cluster protein [Desulfobacteraceae bacterium]
MACKKGCDACCRYLSIFPVEAFAMARAFLNLDQDRRERINARIKEAPEVCPLLVDHVCVLYHARPLICRTHGYPVTFESDGALQVDFCPLNFKGVQHFDQEILISLDQLNQVLFAVNARFLDQIDTEPLLPDRIPIGDALFLLA